MHFGRTRGQPALPEQVVHGYFCLDDAAVLVGGYAVSGDYIVGPVYYKVHLRPLLLVCASPGIFVCLHTTDAHCQLYLAYMVQCQQFEGLPCPCVKRPFPL